MTSRNPLADSLIFKGTYARQSFKQLAEKLLVYEGSVPQEWMDAAHNVLDVIEKENAL